MGNKLGLLGKRKKEWKEMGVDDWFQWVERGGFEKVEELVWVWVEGDGSELANSSGVSTSELLNCEMVWKIEISELVSEFMLDGILITGESGGGKTKLVAPDELRLRFVTHRVISDRVHRLLVTLSYIRPDRFVQLLSLIPILILLLYLLVSGCLTSLC